MATPKKQIAKREEIDDTGKEVDTEQATGVRYTLLERPNEPVVLQISKYPPHSKLMLAIFGAKTLAGNVVSTAQTNDEDPILAVLSRFEAIANPDEVNWGLSDRTGGPRYDQETVCKAVAAVKGETDWQPYMAKWGTDQIVGGKKLKWENAAMRREDVKAKYAELRPPKPVEAPALDSL
jgi:hypothetical protein